jgi:hypothetical protein
VDQRRGGVLAHRRWQPVQTELGAKAPFLCSAVNNRHNDNLFQPRKDEYLVLAFLSGEELNKSEVMVEIDGFGVPAIFLVHHAAGYWQVNVKVPPGIGPGDHGVRVGTRRGGFSESVGIQMLPAGAERRYGDTPFIEREIATDAPAVVRAENTMDRSLVFRGYRNETLACRFTHSAVRLNKPQVQLTVDGNAWPLLSVERPEPGIWQINARLKDLPRGEHWLRLRTADSPFSEAFKVESEPAS